MLQTLLADRFRLTLHRETRELPVYDLTAKKSGFKLPAAEGRKLRFLSARHARRNTCPGRSTVAMRRCYCRPSGLRMEGRKLHMADLVRELASTLGRAGPR